MRRVAIACMPLRTASRPVDRAAPSTCTAYRAMAGCGVLTVAAAFDDQLATAGSVR
jgi:hypothetical protein